MDGDEREIYNYLKTRGHEFVSAREVCRRAAGKKRYYDEPDWAKPYLLRMMDRHILENDAMGRYRIKPISKKDKDQRWVAPNIAEILKEGGVEVESGDIAPDDDYYEQL
jgi:hypothetical protein